MKTKCPKCGTGKARRICARTGGKEICSECCASIRDEDCVGCVHYASTLSYEKKRESSALGLGSGDFMMEINEEVSSTVNYALEAAQRGRVQSASETLTALWRDHPRHYGVAFGIGAIHALKGEHETAIEWFDRAIAIFPDNIESHYNKAVAYQELMDIPNCIRSFQKVVAIGPANDPEVERARGILRDMAATVRKNYGINLDAFLMANDNFNEAFKLMESEDWAGALEGFQSAAGFNDRNAPCHGNMALCYAYLGRKSEALASFDRALEIDPKYTPAISNRKLVAKLEEGTPVENVAFQSINHSLEKFLETRD